VNLVWIRHLEHGGTAQVPESAVPIYRQSNWDLMSDSDVAEMENALAQRSADAEQAMANTPVVETPATQPAPAAADPGPAPAPRKSGNKENS
jgi:hypothetical protein